MPSTWMVSCRLSLFRYITPLQILINQVFLSAATVHLYIRFLIGNMRVQYCTRLPLCSQLPTSVGMICGCLAVVLPFRQLFLSICLHTAVSFCCPIILLDYQLLLSPLASCFVHVCTQLLEAFPVFTQPEPGSCFGLVCENIFQYNVHFVK
jgi:hypothetical protein